MALSVFVNDSQTFVGTIPGVDGVSPPLGFTYRCAPQGRCNDYRTAIDRAGGGDEQAAVAAKFISKYLLAWDVKTVDADNNPVPIAPTSDNVLRLNDHFVTSLVLHILGRIGSKPADPNG